MDKLNTFPIGEDKMLHMNQAKLSITQQHQAKGIETNMSSK